MIEEVATNVNSTASFNWTSLILTIYLLGVSYFAVKLLIQLSTIKKIKKTSDIIEDDNFYHVKTKKQISPFSFFKHIFYFPKQFKGAELRTIIEHEKVHARELHSIDILLTEILFIILWFNPIIWFYRIIIKQNLEFLADAKTCALDQDKKNYQYLMLKQALGNHNISIANPFYNSIIKKRIVMLNQNQSKSINRLKLLLVLPFLGLFLFGFNTKEVLKFSEPTYTETSLTEELPEFISPLKQEDIERVTFGFGETNTATGVKFHNGIDLVGRAGKNVMASADGIVKKATENEENGNYVVIEHSEGYSTKYMHLRDRNVTPGEKVSSGKTIGHVGNTGKSTGPHLHFEILKKDKPVNPASFIPFKTTKNEVQKQKNSSLNKPSYSKTVKTIELKIDKNTTDESLEKMKSDLAKDATDFSYTVVRNSSKEIIDISIQITGTGTNGKKFNGNYNTSSDSPIYPITILYDDESNAVSFWNSKSTFKKFNKNQNTMVWIDSDDEDNPKQIEIKKINGKKIITVDGKEIDEEELEDMKIFISKDGKSNNMKFYIDSDYDDNQDGNGGVFIIRDDDDNQTKIKVRSSYSDNEKEPLIYIDGKKATKKQMAKLKSNKIKSVNVLKGKAAKEKYGKLGSDGVVEVKTKGKGEVIIFKNSDDEIKEDENVFIINTDEAGDYDNDIKFVSKGPKPIYIVNGKQVKKIKNTNPNEIESVSVLKSKAARKKYGRKGKNGVVEIITKEKN
ncbi:peptidoglycan DD-metalloendopeptidase family protein [uncultured Croceitalea sp.]|uniref:peptidoglycan DD-metalloendopeptidase family protein n=1 Tax=uncultured Croceitalea sp. TaxID=1798908 RepID=UPI00374E9395